MKLSEFDNTSLQKIYLNINKEENVITANIDFSDEEISNIVFSDTEDNNLNCDGAIIFGNQDMIKERTEKAVEMYNNKRVKLLLFTGGSNGITSKPGQKISEARQMADLAIKMGIPKEDILVEENSNNSFENVTNSIKLLENQIGLKNINNIMLITSDFHLKRCYAIFMKYLPDKNYSLVGVKNGYSDFENWYESELYWGSGRSIVTFEANVLIKYAKEKKIYDLTINKLKNMKI